jgi:hypothetical protein
MMRCCLIVVLVLTGSVLLGKAEEPTPANGETAPAAKSEHEPGKVLTAEQLEHARKAAESLEAAGLVEDAKKLREQLAAVEQDQANQLLDAKLAELTELEREVSRLRTLTGRHPYVAIHVQIVTCERHQLKAKGLQLGEGAIAPFPNPKSPGWSFEPADAKASQQALATLREQQLSKPLTDATLMTTYERTAWFNDGGEFPVPTSKADGSFGIEWKKWGTLVEFLPHPRGAKGFKFDLRARVSQQEKGRDISLAGTTVPALSVTEMDTGAELDPGQSINLAHAGTAIRGEGDEARAIERLTLVVATPETMTAEAFDDYLRKRQKAAPSAPSKPEGEKGREVGQAAPDPFLQPQRIPGIAVQPLRPTPLLPESESSGASLPETPAIQQDLSVD